MTKLSEPELIEIRRMAETGMSLTEIRATLGYSFEELSAIQDDDPRVLDAYNSGRADGVRAVSDALLRSTQAGDVSAARLLLRRVEGQDQEEAAAVSTKDREWFAEQAAIIVPRIAAALERQRSYRSNVIRGQLPEGLSDAELEALFNEGRIGRYQDGKGNVLGYCALGGQG